jgi:hypothetical protein
MMIQVVTVQGSSPPPPPLAHEEDDDDENIPSSDYDNYNAGMTSEQEAFFRNHQLPTYPEIQHLVTMYEKTYWTTTRGILLTVFQLLSVAEDLLTVFTFDDNRISPLWVIACFFALFALVSLRDGILSLCFQGSSATTDRMRRSEFVYDVVLEVAQFFAFLYFVHGGNFLAKWSAVSNTLLALLVVQLAILTVLFPNHQQEDYMERLSEEARRYFAAIEAKCTLILTPLMAVPFVGAAIGGSTMDNSPLVTATSEALIAIVLGCWTILISHYITISVRLLADNVKYQRVHTAGIQRVQDLLWRTSTHAFMAHTPVGWMALPPYVTWFLYVMVWSAVMAWNLFQFISFIGAIVIVGFFVFVHFRKPGNIWHVLIVEYYVPPQ